MKKRVNPAWLPAGVYLGLGLLAAVVVCLGPFKKEIDIGRSYDRAMAVFVCPETTFTRSEDGKVVCGELEFSGTVTSPLIFPGGGKFSGSLHVFPSIGVLAGYDQHFLSLSRPLGDTRSPLSSEDGKSLYWNEDHTAFCYGPVTIGDWYSSLGLEQYYIIAPVGNGVSAKDVLASIPNAPDLTPSLDASPVVPQKLVATSEDMELTVVNCGGETYDFGTYYNLEQYSYDTGVWMPLDYRIDNAAWTTVAYPVMPGEQRTFSMDWAWLYGALPEGKYRITKYYFPESDPQTKLTLSAEFLV